MMTRALDSTTFWFGVECPIIACAFTNHWDQHNFSLLDMFVRDVLHSYSFIPTIMDFF